MTVHLIMVVDFCSLISLQNFFLRSLGKDSFTTVHMSTSFTKPRVRGYAYDNGK
jgi:hypothetical protein